MPSAKDIRARNELFAKKARETQNLRNAKGANRRGLLHEHKEVEPKTSRWVQYLAIFVLLLLGGGFIMEMLFLFMRASASA
ncbi:hypothetical protein MCAP1_000837 [Malassezia caprae]|uniref:Uncharacterized protein n=1 Tax=Malassezia caprae TaxID=1381934 RepID=A0AAF0E8D8_9BASI|nr:hypothetical protein MCAP1_000837 [Malassezia caprae]